MLRSKIALGCADGKTNSLIAAEVGTTEKTVGKWRLRFSKYGVGTLSDVQRSGVPRTITDEMVAKVIETTLNETPGNETHWSTYSLAKNGLIEFCTIGSMVYDSINPGKWQYYKTHR